MPLEYYRMEETQEKPEELLQKYKNSESGKIEGFSKWFFNNGGFEWKSCEVVKFDSDKERFVIMWPDT